MQEVYKMRPLDAFEAVALRAALDDSAKRWARDGTPRESIVGGAQQRAGVACLLLGASSAQMGSRKWMASMSRMRTVP